MPTSGLPALLRPGGLAVNYPNRPIFTVIPAKFILDSDQGAGISQFALLTPAQKCDSYLPIPTEEPL
jgi:hypothetical protein